MPDNKLKSKGSITVEAALILPLFISFFMVFLYFFHILLAQDHLQEVITDVGVKLAREAYVYQRLNSGLDDSKASDMESSDLISDYKDIFTIVKDVGYVSLLVGHKADLDFINSSCIEGGYRGISFLKSSVLGDDEYININMEYSVKAPVPLFDVKSNIVTQQIRLKSWTGLWINNNMTGKDGNGEDEDKKTVYVTRTGSVYHRSSECSHIKLSISTVSGIPTDLRNNNGGKYHPCEMCLKNSKGEEVAYYITKEGVRYHKDLTCSGIKRDVIAIDISEVVGRRPCSRCGQLSGN